MEGIKVEKDTGPLPPKKPSRYYRGSNHQSTAMVKADPKFQGRNEDLKGHVFDCYNGKQADQYGVTMKEISEYIGSNYAYGVDIRWSLEHEALFFCAKTDEASRRRRREGSGRICKVQSQEHRE
jgi:hypothetical protein